MKCYIIKVLFKVRILMNKKIFKKIKTFLLDKILMLFFKN